MPFYRRRGSHRTRAVDRHPAGRDVLLGEKCTTTSAGHRRAAACPRWRRAEARHRGTSPTDAKPASLTMNLPVRSFGFLRFTPERFHVLLNSLFKVLFNFPSRYLFAIGLVVVFSLRWSLPPTWSCTLKQPDSKERSSRGARRSLRAWHPPRVSGPIQDGLGRGAQPRDKRTLPNTTFPCGGTAGFGAGLFPVRSPLLRKSWLVSFPPLSNMLKFSG